jgi:hypothetical protein
MAARLFIAVASGPSHQLRLIDRVHCDRISIHQAEYNVHRTIWLDPEASGAEPVAGPFGFSVRRWQPGCVFEEFNCAHEWEGAEQ